MNFGGCDRIIDTVMYIKLRLRAIADTASANICLVSDNQCRSHRVDRESRRLIVIAYGRDNCGDVIGIHIHSVQQSEGHYGSALSVIHSVDYISDVVEIASDASQFHLMFGIPQKM